MDIYYLSDGEQCVRMKLSGLLDNLRYSTSQSTTLDLQDAVQKCGFWAGQIEEYRVAVIASDRIAQADMASGNETISRGVDQLEAVFGDLISNMRLCADEMKRMAGK